MRYYNHQLTAFRVTLEHSPNGQPTSHWQNRACLRRSRDLASIMGPLWHKCEGIMVEYDHGYLAYSLPHVISIGPRPASNYDAISNPPTRTPSMMGALANSLLDTVL